jgi:hypothetical protein
MLSAQDDSGSAKSSKTDASGRRGGSYGMILLGVALLTCALLLYWYYKINSPKPVTESGAISNTRSGVGAETPRPLPSPSALSSNSLNREAAR